MRDHRGGEQVEPEGDVAAPRLAHPVAAVPPHREGEHAEAGDQHQRHRQRAVGARHTGNREHERDRGGGERGGAGGDGDRHHETLPVEPGRAGGDERHRADQNRTGGFAEVLAEDILAMLDEEADHRREDAARKGEDEDDAGQGACGVAA